MDTSNQLSGVYGDGLRKDVYVSNPLDVRYVIHGKRNSSLTISIPSVTHLKGLRIGAIILKDFLTGDCRRFVMTVTKPKAKKKTHNAGR